jgi:hypothetical protein
MAAGDVPDYQQAITPAPPVSPISSYTDVVIDESSSGASTLVAAVTSKRIVVYSLYLVADGAVGVKFQSHTTPTDLTGLASVAANGGLVLPFNQDGWFRTASGEALDINLSDAVAVGGVLKYGTV